MASFLDFAGMFVAQQAGRQELERVAEPSDVTDAADNVAEYDQVMTTKLVLAYVVGLEIIHRARPHGEQAGAVDLACGPGHFTLCLARYLDYEAIMGIDLSGPMVEVATRNARKQGLEHRAAFRAGDATGLSDLGAAEFDLATFTDAAHHMPDLGRVTSVLREMDRITKPEGLVMVMDLVRLRTAKLTERYLKTLGQDYVRRGLCNFYEDFRNSMYAAWTPQELRQAIPARHSERYWCQIVPRGLPSTQVILGLPVGRDKPFVRGGSPWRPKENPVPREMRLEWRILRATLALASKTLIAPGAAPRR